MQKFVSYFHLARSEFYLLISMKVKFYVLK